MKVAQNWGALGQVLRSREESGGRVDGPAAAAPPTPGCSNTPGCTIVSGLNSFGPSFLMFGARSSKCQGTKRTVCLDRFLQALPQRALHCGVSGVHLRGEGDWLLKLPDRGFTRVCVCRRCPPTPLAMAGTDCTRLAQHTLGASNWRWSKIRQSRATYPPPPPAARVRVCACACVRVCA